MNRVSRNGNAKQIVSRASTIRLVSFRYAPTNDWEQRMNRVIIMLLGTDNAREGNILDNINGRMNNDKRSIHDGKNSPCGEQGIQA